MTKNNKYDSKIAIIILNWNGFIDTCKCIQSILNTDYPNISIIVVDNDSKNNEAEKLGKQFGNKITLVQNMKNLGYAGGNNSGVKEAKKQGCDFIMVLNNDTEVCPDIITRMLKPFNDEKVALVGASILDFYDREKIQCRGLTFNIWTGVTLAIGLNSSIEKANKMKAFVASGAGLMVRTSILPGDVLFDPEYFCYYEDTDLSYRIWQLGLKVVVLDDAYIYHKGSVSSDKISGFGEYQMIKNRFLIESKQANFIQKVVFLLVSFFLYQPFRLIVILLIRQPEKLKFFVKGFYSGLWDFIIHRHQNLDWSRE